MKHICCLYQVKNVDSLVRAQAADQQTIFSPACEPRILSGVTGPLPGSIACTCVVVPPFVKFALPIIIQSSIVMLRIAGEVRAPEPRGLGMAETPVESRLVQFCNGAQVISVEGECESRVYISADALRCN